jgi:hypothetical protein
MLNSINTAFRSLDNLGSSNINSSLSLLQYQLQNVTKSASELVNLIGKVVVGKQNYTGKSDSTAISTYGSLKKEVLELEDSIAKLSARLMSVSISDDQRKAIEAVLESYNSLMAEMDTITQSLTGTTVKDLGNSLAEAFLSGEVAAESWGKTVDDIIKNVIISQMSANLLQKPIQKAIDQLIADSDQGLTSGEAEKFKTAVQAVSQSVAPAFEAARKSLEAVGINVADATTKQGLSGDIQRVTEETASILSGNIAAIRLNMQKLIESGSESMTLLQKSLEYQRLTADNTEGIWKVLDKIDARFLRIETDGIKVK